MLLHYHHTLLIISLPLHPSLYIYIVLSTTQRIHKKLDPQPLLCIYKSWVYVFVYPFF